MEGWKTYMPQGINGCYQTWLVAEFVAKGPKNQKLPENWFQYHNKNPDLRPTQLKPRSGKFPNNIKQKEKPPTARSSSAVRGAPNRIRTCGLLIRSQTLYPAELWVRLFARNRRYYIKGANACQHFFSFFSIFFWPGRSEVLRLSFLLQRGLPIAGNRGILFMK